MFDKLYRCFSVSPIGTNSRVEDGDKILMPASALALLSTMRVDYPLLFKLTNTRTNKASHCGVMEFTAEEGTVVLPNWSMLNLGLVEGDLVRVSNASLERATFVKLRPHQTAFCVHLSDPKAVLERSLRSFSCLTVGDTFAIPYLDRKFRFDVLETRPGFGSAVSIIETDCEVDFAEPLDYVSPENHVSKKVKIEARPGFSGAMKIIKTDYEEEEEEEEEEKETEDSFKAFTGVGRRLDGSSTKPVLKENPSSKLNHGGTETGAFSVKEEEKGFKPFTGKSYRLM